ncbi:MAG: hypothetical protein WC807_13015 [Hyphomicrobium sp.]|jgi:hypothetical protein
MRTTQTVISAFAAAAVLAAAPAHAADPAYVGTWAGDLGQCKIAQDRQEAPLILSKDSYDQHEAHCTFKTVDGKDSEFTVTSSCLVEGDQQPYDFKLTISGDTLTVTDDTGARDLLKCK